jgi:ribonuclease E
MDSYARPPEPVIASTVPMASLPQAAAPIADNTPAFVETMPSLGVIEPVAVPAETAPSLGVVAEAASPAPVLAPPAQVAQQPVPAAPPEAITPVPAPATEHPAEPVASVEQPLEQLSSVEQTGEVQELAAFHEPVAPPADPVETEARNTPLV